MGLLSALKERLRDKTRDKLCADLRAIGFDTLIAERGLPEESVGQDLKGKSLGLIEIRDSPIRWINVLKLKGSGGGPSAGDADTYTNLYLVPDPNLNKEGYLELGSVRVKTVPLFGRVIDLRWQGNFVWYKIVPHIGRVHESRKIDNEDNLIRRLNEDTSLTETLIRLKLDMTIRSFLEHAYWVIWSSDYETRWFRADRQPSPSREQWGCYETIARHLLGSSRK